MATDSRNIVIELRVANSSGTPKEESNNTNEEEQNQVVKAATTGILLQAWSYAKQQIASIVTYEISRDLMLTEDYKSQIRINNAKSAIDKTVSLASALAGGAIAGSPGGFVGAAIGAAVATIGWSISETIGVYQKYEQAYTEIAISNYQSAYAMSRMGLINNGRGTQN